MNEIIRRRAQGQTGMKPFGFNGCAPARFQRSDHSNHFADQGPRQNHLNPTIQGNNHQPTGFVQSQVPYTNGKKHFNQSNFQTTAKDSFNSVRLQNLQAGFVDRLGPLSDAKGSNQPTRQEVVKPHYQKTKIYSNPNNAHPSYGHDKQQGPPQNQNSTKLRTTCQSYEFVQCQSAKTCLNQTSLQNYCQPPPMVHPHCPSQNARNPANIQNTFQPTASVNPNGLIQYARNPANFQNACQTTALVNSHVHGQYARNPANFQNTHQPTALVFPQNARHDLNQPNLQNTNQPNRFVNPQDYNQNGRNNFNQPNFENTRQLTAFVYQQDSNQILYQPNFQSNRQPTASAYPQGPHLNTRKLLNPPKLLNNGTVQQLQCPHQNAKNADLKHLNQQTGITHSKESAVNTNCFSFQFIHPDWQRGQDRGQNGFDPTSLQSLRQYTEPAHRQEPQLDVTGFDNRKLPKVQHDSEKVSDLRDKINTTHRLQSHPPVGYNFNGKSERHNSDGQVSKAAPHRIVSDQTGLNHLHESERLVHQARRQTSDMICRKAPDKSCDKSVHPISNPAQNIQTDKRHMDHRSLKPCLRQDIQSGPTKFQKLDSRQSNDKEFDPSIGTIRNQSGQRHHHSEQPDLIQSDDLGVHNSDKYHHFNGKSERHNSDGQVSKAAPHRIVSDQRGLNRLHESERLVHQARRQTSDMICRKAPDKSCDKSVHPISNPAQNIQTDKCHMDHRSLKPCLRQDIQSGPTKFRKLDSHQSNDKEFDASIGTIRQQSGQHHHHSEQPDFIQSDDLGVHNSDKYHLKKSGPKKQVHFGLHESRPRHSKESEHQNNFPSVKNNLDRPAISNLFGVLQSKPAKHQQSNQLRSNQSTQIKAQKIDLDDDDDPFKSGGSSSFVQSTPIKSSQSSSQLLSQDESCQSFIRCSEKSTQIVKLQPSGLQGQPARAAPTKSMAESHQLRHQPTTTSKSRQSRHQSVEPKTDRSDLSRRSQQPHSHQSKSKPNVLRVRHQPELNSELGKTTNYWFHCNICSKEPFYITTNPDHKNELNACHHFFCRKCAKRYSKNGKKCPTCNRSVAFKELRKLDRKPTKLKNTKKRLKNARISTKLAYKQAQSLIEQLEGQISELDKKVERRLQKIKTMKEMLTSIKNRQTELRKLPNPKSPPSSTRRKLLPHLKTSEDLLTNDKPIEDENRLCHPISDFCQYLKKSSRYRRTPAADENFASI